jgi:photosystem II stability/assembly factor-like uncharacterized protein
MKKSLTISLLLVLIPMQFAFCQWEQLTIPSGNSGLLGANNQVVLAMTNDALYSSSDHGQTWTTSGNGIVQLPIKYIFSMPETSTFYACSEEYIYKSTDNGANWTTISGPENFTNLRSVYYFNGALFALADYGENQGLHRSYDEGQTWEPLTNGLTSNGVRSITHDDNYLYVGLIGTGPESSPGVFRSIDNGANWEYASTGLDADIDHMASLGNRIYASSYSYVYYSIDQGNSWNYTLCPQPGIPIASIISVENYLIACHMTGAYKLKNNDNSWESWNDNLNTMMAWGITTDGIYSYCSTGDIGIWRRPLDQLVGIGENPSLNNISNLISIYPNPAQSVVSMQSSIYSQQSAIIEVYDLNGRKLLEKQIPKGSESVEIDVSHLQSGVYCCTMITEQGSATKKLIIQK